MMKVMSGERTLREILGRTASAYEGKLGVYARIRRRLVPDLFFADAVEVFSTSRSVVDLGCGIGLITLALAQLLPDTRFLGIDLSARRVQTAALAAGRLGVGNVTFLQSDLRSLDVGPGFDGALILDVLHHLPVRASGQLLAVLNQGMVHGAVVVVKEIDTRPRWKWAFTYALDLAMAPRDDYGYLSLERRKAQMEDAGFKVRFARSLRSRLPYPHFVVIAERP